EFPVAALQPLRHLTASAARWIGVPHGLYAARQCAYKFAPGESVDADTLHRRLRLSRKTLSRPPILHALTVRLPVAGRLGRSADRTGPHSGAELRPVARALSRHSTSLTISRNSS